MQFINSSDISEYEDVADIECYSKYLLLQQFNAPMWKV